MVLFEDEKPLYNLETYREDESFLKKALKKTLATGLILSSLVLASGEPRNLASEYLKDRSFKVEQVVSEGSKDKVGDGFGEGYNSVIQHDVVRLTNSVQIRKNYIQDKMAEVNSRKGIDVPEGLVTVAYDGEKEGKIMYVKYSMSDLNNGEPVVPTDLKVTDSAFELEHEDDFLSTLIHEYNHVRALNRSEVIDNEKYYTDIDSDLHWSDIFSKESYGGEFDNFYKEVTEEVQTPILEILALEEQLYHHERGLDVSESYDFHVNSLYLRYVGELEQGLEKYDACETLYDDLNDFLSGS